MALAAAAQGHDGLTAALIAPPRKTTHVAWFLGSRLDLVSEERIPKLTYSLVKKSSPILARRTPNHDNPGLRFIIGVSQDL